MVTEKDLIHKKYLDICEGLIIDELRGYNIKQLLYNEVFYVISMNWKVVFKLLIKTMLFDWKSGLTIVQDRRNDDVVLVWRKGNRRDHDSYWEKICNACEEYTRMSFEEEDLSLKKGMKCFSLKGALKNTEEFVRVYRQIKKFNNIKHRAYLTCRLLKMKQVTQLLNEASIVPKVAMCAFDSSFYENVAMQYYKQRGVITIANQHGQPVFKSHDYDRMNQSQVLNFKCDYFLAKGEFTRTQFVAAGQDRERIIVIGSFNQEKKVQKPCRSGNMFCTFLNCINLPNAQKVNEKLLEISRELSKRLNCKYYIKLHPSDSVDNYINESDERIAGIIGKEKTISELSEDIGFGVFNESSVYLDLLDNRVKPYYWDSNIFFPLVEDSNSIFSNVDEIEEKVKEWYQYSDEEKEKYFAGVSDYYNASGDVDNKIRDFIHSLL